MAIDKTAIVSKGAELDESVIVGPYAVIGPSVKIGAGTNIGAHVVIDGITKIGQNCRIYAGAVLGLPPQDLRYKDEPTGVVIGNNVTIREYVTIHRATGEGCTVIGDNCFLMNYAHIAHNCQLGQGVIMANATTLAGHVNVGDFTVFSGFCILHQFVRLGRFVMVGGMTGSRVDLPPFTMCDGRPASVRGINVVGLRRGRMAGEIRAAIKQAYKLIYRSNLNVSQALARIEEELEPYEEIREICQFFKSSKRGVASAFSAYEGEQEESGTMNEAPVEALF